MLAELLDRVPAVLEDPRLAVDVGDRRAAGGRVGEGRVVAHQSEVVLGDLDLAQVHRLDRPVGDLDLVALAGAVVGDREGVAAGPAFSPSPEAASAGLVAWWPSTVESKGPPRSSACWRSRASISRGSPVSEPAIQPSGASEGTVVRRWPFDEEGGRARDAARRSPLSTSRWTRLACAPSSSSSATRSASRPRSRARASQVALGERARLVEAVQFGRTPPWAAGLGDDLHRPPLRVG